MKRYQIRWARLDPIEGAEMGKVRPVVIITLDILITRLGTVTICPVTSKLHPDWRTRLSITCAGRRAEIAVDQIRTLSRSRVGPLIDTLRPNKAQALRELITEMYGEA